MTNYPTTAVGWYLSGNYDDKDCDGVDIYRAAQAVVKETAENASDETRETRVIAVRDALKEWFIDRLPALDGIAKDLLTYAAEEIDWRELARDELEIIEMAS